MGELGALKERRCLKVVADILLARMDPEHGQVNCAILADLLLSSSALTYMPTSSAGRSDLMVLFPEPLGPANMRSRGTSAFNGRRAGFPARPESVGPLL